jgi:hypothetical protein
VNAAAEDSKHRVCIISDSGISDWQTDRVNFITVMMPLRSHISLQNVAVSCWLVDRALERYGLIPGEGSAASPDRLEAAAS